MRYRQVGRLRVDKEGMARFVVGDHRVRARHHASQPGARALGHRRPAPRGQQVPIDIGALAGLGQHQSGQPCRCSSKAFELSQELTQRGAVRAPATPRRERRLVGITRGEALAATQGRKKQGRKAATQRLGTLRQQGNVVCWPCALLGRNRLREPGHHRPKGIRLIAVSYTHLTLPTLYSV